MAGRADKRKCWPLSAALRLTPSARGRRRYNCDDQAQWDERAGAAAMLLAKNYSAWGETAGRPVSIADFGAGNERMRSLLEATLDVDHTYHPYDLHPQMPTTIRLNVIDGLPDRAFDIVICLGLLEYLPSIPAMAASLREHCHFALTSYVTADGPASIARPAREQRNWLTHATEAGLRADFAAVGFTQVASARSDNEATWISLWGGA